MKITKRTILDLTSKGKNLNDIISKLKFTKTKLKQEMPKEILDAIELVGKIQALENDLNTTKEALKESIKKVMDKVQLAEIVSGDFKANYSQFTSTNFDSKLLKEEKPEVYESYINTINKTRFSVSANKKAK